ncbi:hypothetical protein ACFLRI_01760 [Bacteroidota bacterium]
MSCDGFHEQYIPLDVNVNSVEQFVVINAKIEKDSFALVQISYSEDIDASVTTPFHFENDAVVTLKTDDGNAEILRYFKYGWYYGRNIIGKVGTTYTLTIDIGEKSYEATSTMLAPRGYQDAWVTITSGKDNSGKGGSSYYSDEWIINDPSNERNRYLFEWWSNGVHYVQQDWCIDDNRVVNANEGLRLFTVTLDPGPNEHIRHRTAEVDLLTYHYYNMYEKIVRGLVGVSSQTPYNPVSNFGDGTIGNFRAVAFASKVVLTPPDIVANGGSKKVVLSFPLNKYFTKYNLYWNEKAGVSKNSNVINDLKYNTSDFKNASYTHDNLTYGSSYFYRIEVEDVEGNISILSPEVSAIADSTSSSTGNSPTNIVIVAGTGQITISWDPVTGTEGYFIYWDTKPGVTEKSNIIYEKGIKSPYTHTGLTKGVTYYYRVASYFGKTVYLSDEVSAVPD